MNNKFKVKTKKCSKCGEIKSVNEFYKDKRYEDNCYPSCKECKRKLHRQYYKKHTEFVKQLVKQWCKQNTEYRNQYLKQFKKRNINYRLSQNISSAIWHSSGGNRNGNYWQDLVDYNLKDLIIHLEKLFKPGMNWNNYGRNGWTIDHIIPKSYFKYNSYNDLEFKKCWALENLQPLWAKENLIKGKKIIGNGVNYD